jgi:hypothetical protein
MIEQHYKPGYVIEVDAGREAQDPRACPACRRIDTTVKASSVARSHRGRLVLEDGTLAAYESELASLLSRPPRPALLSGGVIAGALITGWLLLALDLGIVALLQGQESLSIPESALETAAYLGLAWFGLVIPGAAIVRYYLRLEQANRELPSWREDVRRWSSFHYCSRDDLVYVPGEGHGVDPDHLAVLYHRRPRPLPVVAFRSREAEA